ncbi:MAG: ParA family protein [Rhodobacteraceae bacterium]|nr:ParA family protein [Paracoccaceae bacterium]
MTYIITFASSKGGSGKSTFCVNLAAYFGMRGRNVTILDTDFQKSSHDWVRESSDKFLENVKTYVANEENSIRQYIKQSRCDILCVDSQGAVSRELAACLEASDLIITPCRPSRDDLVGLGWVAAFARRVNPKFATSSDRLLPVLNAVNKHSVAFQHARQQLMADGYKAADTAISQRVSQAEANFNRCSIFHQNSRAAQEFRALGWEVMERITQHKSEAAA